METKRLLTTKSDIETAGKILSNGGLVGIPTETVYGLAANALDEKAVKNIFKAKGRPQDNPLIVHISRAEDVYGLVSDFCDSAKRLTEKYWPGPLTVILPKSDKIPSVVSAGLDTVAIRLPENKTARDIITAAGVPLAAPSANLSGSPSPTSASHVLADLDGLIDAVVLGENSKVGLESTVITFVSAPPKILRPGGITYEMIKEIIPDAEIDKAVLNEMKADETPSSPGMKYKHYSPRSRIIMVESDKDNFIKFITEKRKENSNIFALVFDSDLDDVPPPCLSYGNEQDQNEQAEKLFARLRELDEQGSEICFVRSPKKQGVGLAVYNRLIRACAFEVIKI